MLILRNGHVVLSYLMVSSPGIVINVRVSRNKYEVVLGGPLVAEIDKPRGRGQGAYFSTQTKTV